MRHCVGNLIALQIKQISQTLEYMIQESLQKCLRKKQKTMTCGVSQHDANKAEPCLVEEHVRTHMIGEDKLSLDAGFWQTYLAKCQGPQKKEKSWNCTREMK